MFYEPIVSTFLLLPLFFLNRSFLSSSMLLPLFLLGTIAKAPGPTRDLQLPRRITAGGGAAFVSVTLIISLVLGELSRSSISPISSATIRSRKDECSLDFDFLSVINNSAVSVGGVSAFNWRPMLNMVS